MTDLFRSGRTRTNPGPVPGSVVPLGRRSWPAVVAACLAALLLGGGAAGGVPGPGEEIEYSVIAPLTARTLLLDVAETGGALVAVGDRGHVVVSLDHGGSWKQAKVPTRSMLTAVFFVDREHGWAVGHDGVVLRTLGGPDEWERTRWAPEEENPLFDVWFRDLRNGLAVGAYGTLLVTGDGGMSWASHPIGEDDYHLHRIVPVGDETLLIPAEAGKIYRSDDAGRSWRELQSPYEGSFFGLLSLDDGTLLVFGLRGHLFRSEDGGQEWEALETGTTAMLTDGLVLDDGTVVIVGLGGSVLASRDGGRTFELHRQPDRKGIQAIIQDASGGLVLAGEFGVRTVDPAEFLGGSR